jgi:hypothetical protein
VPKDTQHTTRIDHPQLELPERVTIAVAELASAAREGLLALAVGTGLQVLQAMLAEDVARLVGPKGRHNPDRAAVRHGAEPGQVTLGGRRVRVRRPRVRSAVGMAAGCSMAEIELAMLAGQCLDRRLADRATLEREVAAWQAARNRAGRGVNWRFTTKDARIKLKHLYPTTQGRRATSVVPPRARSSRAVAVRPVSKLVSIRVRIGACRCVATCPLTASIMVLFPASWKSRYQLPVTTPDL